MKHWLGALLLVASIVVHAGATDAQLGMTMRETLTLDYPGATAAFAVDPTIVEASIVDGQLVLIGRHIGQTLVTVVQPGKVEALTVRVAPAPGRRTDVDSTTDRTAGALGLHYDSGTRRFGTGLSMSFDEGERSTRLHLYGIHEPDQAGRRELWALPSAHLEFTSPTRRLVLLDERVESSPLTLDGIVLRGFHLRQGALELHTGVASPTLWDDLLLPESGDRALALSYGSPEGSLRLVPTVLWLPDSHTRLPGVLSLALLRGRPDDNLQLKAELGWSARPGASFELMLRDRKRHVWLAGAARPRGFATLNVARPPGGYLDGAWSEQFGQQLTGSFAFSASRLDLGEHQPRSASGHVEMRHQTTARWSLIAGLSGSSYRDTGVDALRRGTASFGGAYDTPAFSVAALYRYQAVSSAGRGGHGGRLTMRGAMGGWRANAFIDAQQQAPTLSLILGDRPELARVLSELGFAATEPEEVLRLLRDHAPLFAEHGVEIGALHRAPLRLHGGLNLAWRDSGRLRSEFGLRLTADNTQGVFGGRRSYLSTVYASRRVLKHTELSASYTWWSMRRDDSPGDNHQFFQVSLRTDLTALPLPAIGAGRAITGWVVVDDALTGIASPEKPPLAGVEVVLDRWRRTRTDRDGRFVFDAPGPGQHRVEVVLPATPGAYFTAASAVSVPAGGEARFAITFSAPQLTGTVSSDAGVPLAGVRVRLEGTAQAIATTDSEGTFRFSAPAGEVRVSIFADSVPPGYELGDLDPKTRRLVPGAPAVADFALRAQRALKGVVKGKHGGLVTVTAVETGRSVKPDPNGRFLLRGLPAGSLTLLVKTPHGEARRQVEIPAEPGTVADVELEVP